MLLTSLLLERGLIMDGILLPVKGQAAKNLARTLELPSFTRPVAQEEKERIFKAWEKNKKVEKQKGE